MGGGGGCLSKLKRLWGGAACPFPAALLPPFPLPLLLLKGLYLGLELLGFLTCLNELIHLVITFLFFIAYRLSSYLSLKAR